MFLSFLQPRQVSTLDERKWQASTLADVVFGSIMRKLTSFAFEQGKRGRLPMFLRQVRTIGAAPGYFQIYLNEKLLSI